MSTVDFDATTIDPGTVKLAGASVIVKKKGKLMSSFEELNGDGLLDLILHFDIKALGLSKTDKMAVLEGRTFDGTPITESDAEKPLNNECNFMNSDKINLKIIVQNLHKGREEFMENVNIKRKRIILSGIRLIVIFAAGKKGGMI